MVEQCPFKAWVAGSNPAALTRTSKSLGDFGQFRFRPPPVTQNRRHADSNAVAVTRIAFNFSANFCWKNRFDNLTLKNLGYSNWLSKVREGTTTGRRILKQSAS